MKKYFTVSMLVIFLCGAAVAESTSWFRTLRTDARAPQSMQQPIQDRSVLGSFNTSCMALAAKYRRSKTVAECESDLMRSQIVHANALRFLLSANETQKEEYAKSDVAGKVRMVEGNADMDKLAWFVELEKVRMKNGFVANTNRTRLTQDILSPAMGMDRINQLIAGVDTSRGGRDSHVSGIPVSAGPSVARIDPDCLKPVPFKTPGKPNGGPQGPTGPGGGDPQDGGKSGAAQGGKIDCSQLDPVKQGGGGQAADESSQATETPPSKDKDDGLVKDDPADDLKDKDGKTGAEKQKEKEEKQKQEDEKNKNKNKKDDGLVDDLQTPKYDDEGGFGGGCNPSPTKAVLACLGVLADSGEMGFDPCANAKLLGMPGPDGFINCGGKKGTSQEMDKIYQDTKDPGKGPAGDPNPEGSSKNP